MVRFLAKIFSEDTAESVKIQGLDFFASLHHNMLIWTLESGQISVTGEVSTVLHSSVLDGHVHNVLTGNNELLTALFRKNMHEAEHLVLSVFHTSRIPRNHVL